MGFWVFLVHPTVVSVLLSASVERCFVSRVRDFFLEGFLRKIEIRVSTSALCGGKKRGRDAERKMKIET